MIRNDTKASPVKHARRSIPASPKKKLSSPQGGKGGKGVFHDIKQGDPSSKNFLDEKKKIPVNIKAGSALEMYPYFVAVPPNGIAT